MEDILTIIFDFLKVILTLIMGIGIIGVTFNSIRLSVFFILLFANLALVGIMFIVRIIVNRKRGMIFK